MNPYCLVFHRTQSAVFNSTVIYYADPVLIDVFCNACRDRPYSKWNDAAVDDPAGHLRVIAGKLEDCAMGDRSIILSGMMWYPFFKIADQREVEAENKNRHN